MDSFLTYTRFYTAEDTKPLIELLNKEGIPYQLEHETNQLDAVYLGESLDPMFAIKIPQDQFSKLNFLLGDDVDESIKTADDDYYLFSFSNEELISVIKDSEEWNAYDRSLAQKILIDRRIPIPETTSISAQSTYQPERLKTEWLVIGYLLCMTTILGIFFGLAIVNGRKTLSNGQKVPLYDETSIGHGKNMIILACVFLAVYLLRIFL